MPKKYLLISGAVAVVVIALILAVSFWLTSGPTPDASQPSPEPAADEPFTPEVEAVLERKTALVMALVGDPLVVEAVRLANAAHAAASLQEILALDRRWREAPAEDEFVRAHLTNDIAKKLLDFQEVNPGFSEIFVTDARGLNVGQTNKTTDYYQADEEWWVAAFADGLGRELHGAIEFDESARSEAIALYVPVLDPQTRRALGVAKAVLNISAVKIEL